MKKTKAKKLPARRAAPADSVTSLRGSRAMRETLLPAGAREPLLFPAGFLPDVTPPSNPSLEAMKTAQAYVDPTKLINAQLFVPYNPSVLVTRKGLAVFDSMMLDPQVKAALSFKVLSVLAGGWEVQSPDDQEAKWEVTEFVRNALSFFPGGWNSALKKMLRALRHGYSVLEKVYGEPESGPLQGKITLQRLVELKPHYIDFETDHSGLVTGVVQMPMPLSNGPRLGPVFSPLKFVHYVYDREFENPYGKSDLEAAYLPWWVKDNAYKWFAMLLERFGIPPLLALYDPQFYQGANLEDLKKVVRNIQAATMGIIPRATAEALEFYTQQLGAGNREIFTAAFARFDADIAKALLQPSLIGFAQEAGSTGAQSGGSLARSNTSWKAFMYVVTELQEDLESQAINSQIIPQLCDMNYVGLKSYPLFRFARLDDEMELELFKVWQALVEGKLVNRLTDDETHIRKALGMPENDAPVLEDLPQDADRAANAEAEAAAQAAKAAAGALPSKAKKVPPGQQSKQMQEFAEARNADWYDLDGHFVCFAKEAA